MENEVISHEVDPEKEKERQILLAIEKSVIKLEHVNYAQKPDDMKDYEMVQKIKNIIQTEAEK